MFFKAAPKQNHQTTAFQAHQLGKLATLLHHLLHPEFRKIHLEMCIFCWWPLLGSIVYHYLFYRMHLGWPFPIFLFLLSSFFKKVLSALGGKHNFENRTTPFCINNTTCLDSQEEGKTTIIVTLPVPIAPLFVRFGFFSLHEPMKNLIMANDLCIFSLQSPVSKNDCMHRTSNFAKFVCDLQFSLCHS